MIIWPRMGLLPLRLPFTFTFSPSLLFFGGRGGRHYHPAYVGTWNIGTFLRVGTRQSSFVGEILIAELPSANRTNLNAAAGPSSPRRRGRQHRHDSRTAAPYPFIAFPTAALKPDMAVGTPGAP